MSNFSKAYVLILGNIGATIGSTQLDNLFEKAVLDRLEMANRSLPMGVDGLDQIAWEMRISKEYQWVSRLIALQSATNPGASDKV